MKTLLYLHGFAGSGSSGTATYLRNALYEFGVQVMAPDIPPLQCLSCTNKHFS